MPRLSKIIIMGTLPLILAAACCCSSSPLIQLLSANLQTPEVSTAIQMGDDTNTPGDGSNNQDITATFVETNTAFPTETSIPTATETAIPTATLTASPVPPASLSADRFVTYDIVQYIDLTAEGHGKATDINLNVALIHSVSPYQEVTSREISPSTYQLLTDDYGNEYAYFLLDHINNGDSISFEIRYVVNVYEIKSTLGMCMGDLPATDIDSEKYIEADDPLVVDLERQLSDGKVTVCDQERSFYDYLVDNMTYGGYNPGELGAAEALRTLEGDCTEFSDSMVALSRSAEIPARFLEGVVCCTANGYADGKNKHNWLEVYLPVIGWAPMDPTWGQQPMDRDKYFAGVSPDHIIVTIGRNLERLGGYHYFYYTYYRETSETQLTWQEEWSILIR